MGPRRISAALAVLALGLLLATAGAAAASSSSPSSGHGHQVGGPVDHSQTSSPERPRVTEHPVTQAPPRGHPSDGVHGSANGSPGGSTDPHDDGNPQEEPPSGGGVNAAGTPPAGVPQTPVPAPAAAVDGPAPAAAAAAPTVSVAQVAAGTAAGAGTTGTGTTGTGANAGTGTTGADAPAETPAVTPVETPLVPVADPFSLSGLPQLRTLGELAASVTDGPSTARALLATPAGRSVAVLLGLVLAIILFLSVHRRLDRDDPKLATAPSGSDVARFR